MALFRRHIRGAHFGVLIRLSFVFLALVIILFLLGLARVTGFTGAFAMPSIIRLWSCSIRRPERKDYLYGERGYITLSLVQKRRLRGKFLPGIYG